MQKSIFFGLAFGFIFLILYSMIPSSEASDRSTEVSIQFSGNTCCVIGETPIVIIKDSEANKDSSLKETIVFTVYSKSNPTPIEFTANEVPLRNSEKFVGHFSINDITTKVGDTLIVSYSYQSHGQTFTILESNEIRELGGTSTNPFVVYVQPLPEWASYANGAVSKAIDFWEKNEDVKFEIITNRETPSSIWCYFFLSNN